MSNVGFQIVITNNGNTVITSMPMEDNFSGATFQFISATTPPNGSGAGSLLWTNLAGTNGFQPGTTLTNFITMQVVGAANPALNTALIDFAVDTNGNAVPTTSSTPTNLITVAASAASAIFTMTPNHSGVFTNTDPPLSTASRFRSIAIQAAMAIQPTAHWWEPPPRMASALIIS